MVFANETLSVLEKEFSFGKVVGVEIGESGRGRRSVFLPTPKNLTEIPGNEENHHLSVGKSRTGRPRIVYGGDSSEIFLVLSSERGYTRRGNGEIFAPKSQEVELICRGNGADGDAGRIGHWDAVVVRAKAGDVFRVVWGGSGYGYDPTFYVVTDKRVYAANQPEVEQLYDELGVEPPFSLEFDPEESQIMIAWNEWKAV